MSSSAEDGLKSLNELKTRLDAAVNSEDYAEAARLRDAIQAQSRLLRRTVQASSRV